MSTVANSQSHVIHCACQIRIKTIEWKFIYTLDNLATLRYARQPAYMTDVTSTFSDWLTAENYNLQQRGHTYRVADTISGHVTPNKKSVHFFPDNNQEIVAPERLSYIECDKVSLGGHGVCSCNYVDTNSLTYVNRCNVTVNPLSTAPLSPRHMTTFQPVEAHPSLTAPSSVCQMSSPAPSSVCQMCVVGCQGHCSC